MDRNEVEVHKNAKKRTRPIFCHLDRTSLVNKGFIIWQKTLRQQKFAFAGPTRAIPSGQDRPIFSACSGSQSKHRIRFILPARRANASAFRDLSFMGTSDVLKVFKIARVLYNGHKRVHAIKFQSVVAPNGLIANLFGPVEGRRHDSGKESPDQICRISSTGYRDFSMSLRRIATGVLRH